jgi:hypothetical protein
MNNRKTVQAKNLTSKNRSTKRELKPNHGRTNPTYKGPILTKIKYHIKTSDTEEHESPPTILPIISHQFDGISFMNEKLKWYQTSIVDYPTEYDFLSNFKKFTFCLVFGQPTLVHPKPVPIDLNQINEEIQNLLNILVTFHFLDVIYSGEIEKPYYNHLIKCAQDIHSSQLQKEKEITPFLDDSFMIYFEFEHLKATFSDKKDSVEKENETIDYQVLVDDQIF